MSLVSKFKGWFAPQDDNVLHTAYGSYNLAKSSDRAALKRTVVEMQRQTDALTRKDLQDWRSAWQMAINVDNLAVVFGSEIRAYLFFGFGFRISDVSSINA